MATSTLDPILEPLYMQLTHTPEEKRNNALIEEKKKRLKVFCAAFDAHLTANGPYVCGSFFTAADCVIGYNVWWASIIQSGALIEEYSSITNYLRMLKGRPTFAKAFSRQPRPSGGSL